MAATATGGSPLQTDLIEGAEAFTRLAPEWDRLVDRSVTSTPFQSLAYQKAWWTHLGPGNLHTIVLRDAGGGLAAIASFYLIDGILYFNGCTEESDYLDLIVPAGRAAAAWDAVFDTLESDPFPRWRKMDLCNIPASSPSRELLQQQAAARGYAARESVQEVCPVIALPATFEEYLLELDKKQRHEIRRKKRRAAGAGAEIVEVGGEDDLEAAVDDFLRLLAQSAPEKAEWLNEGRRAVFHDVARAAAAAGTLQLLFLVREGAAAAALYNFDYNGRIWVYNSGMDIVEFGYLSPGVVLTAGAIEMAIAAGRHSFDFLRGAEEYKYRFGAEDTTVHRMQIGAE